MEANHRSQRDRPAEASAGESVRPTVRLKMRLALTERAHRKPQGFTPGG